MTGLHEADVDARLKAFWSAFTWDVVRDSNAADTRLRIKYVNVDLTLCTRTHSSGSLYATDSQCTRTLEVRNVTAWT